MTAPTKRTLRIVQKNGGGWTRTNATWREGLIVSKPSAEARNLSRAVCNGLQKQLLAAH